MRRVSNSHSGVVIMRLCTYCNEPIEIEPANRYPDLESLGIFVMDLWVNEHGSSRCIGDTSTDVYSEWLPKGWYHIPYLGGI